MKTKDKSRSKQSSPAGSRQSGSVGSYSGGSPSQQDVQTEANRPPSHKIDNKRSRTRGK